jgi:hypothetical protein
MKPNIPKLHFQKEYFLFLLPLFFVLHGFVQNYQYIHVDDTLLLFLKYIIVATVLTLLFFLFFKSWRKACVYIFFLTCLYFFYGPFHDQLKQWFAGSFITKYTFLLPFFFLLFIFLLIVIKRKSLQFNRFTKFANLLLLVLIAIDLVSLVFMKLQIKTTQAIRTQHSSTTAPKPDIYFIIADEYAGNRQLKEVFSFDNSPFENQLRKRGFLILDSTKSNYNYTPFSIASTLKMDYLTGIEGRNQSKRDREICKQQINHSEVADYLKQIGYAFKNFSVFYFNNEEPPVGSTLFTLAGTDLITSQTLFARIDRDIRFNTIATFKLKKEMERFTNEERRDIETIYSLTKEEAAKKSNKPRFVYSHLMMPHYPYFFNSNGKPYPVETLLEGNQSRKDAYIEYLQYSNKKFLDLIDHIIQNSKQPPVILFMGDHGFRHLSNMDPSYHFMNINAVYLPGKNHGGFYNGMTNVNQFRILLNTLFNQQLPLLKDSTSFLQE